MSIETGYRYSHISEEENLTRKEISEAMLALKIGGYCELTPVLDCDGMAAGKVHILTEKGEDLQRELGVEYKGQGYAC